MSFIILDRDGVINYDSDEYIKSPDEWLPIPGSLEAITYLNKAGFRILIATNQSGIARGYYDLNTLQDIHEKFLRELAAVGGQIEEIFFCPHHPDAGCWCRKPKPGLIYSMQEKYHINLAETFFIGDSFADLQAAKTAGCMPLLILSDKGKWALEHYPEFSSIPNFVDLKRAALYVMGYQSKKHA